MASKRDRAIILSQESSGLSASDDPVTNVCTIQYVRKKTGTKAHSFFNPETCEAIIEYHERKNAPPASDKT